MGVGSQKSGVMPEQVQILLDRYFMLGIDRGETPALQAPNVACLDYSMERGTNIAGGKLCGSKIEVSWLPGRCHLIKLTSGKIIFISWPVSLLNQ